METALAAPDLASLDCGVQLVPPIIWRDAKGAVQKVPPKTGTPKTGTGFRRPVVGKFRWACAIRGWHLLLIQFVGGTFC
jgi:hypothetical protein